MRTELEITIPLSSEKEHEIQKVKWEYCLHLSLLDARVCPTATRFDALHCWSHVRMYVTKTLCSVMLCAHSKWFIEKKQPRKKKTTRKGRFAARINSSFVCFSCSSFIRCALHSFPRPSICLLFGASFRTQSFYCPGCTPHHGMPYWTVHVIPFTLCDDKPRHCHFKARHRILAHRSVMFFFAKKRCGIETIKQTHEQEMLWLIASASRPHRPRCTSRI